MLVEWAKRSRGGQGAAEFKARIPTAASHQGVVRPGLGRGPRARDKPAQCDRHRTVFANPTMPFASKPMKADIHASVRLAPMRALRSAPIILHHFVRRHRHRTNLTVTGAER